MAQVKEYLSELTLTKNQLEKMYRAQYEAYKYVKGISNQNTFLSVLNSTSTILGLLFFLPTPVQVLNAFVSLTTSLIPSQKETLLKCLSNGRDFLDESKMFMEDFPQFDQIRLMTPFLEYVSEGVRLVSGQGEITAAHTNNGWVSPGGGN